ncbi:Uncharacterised protein [Mycobacteroides abscessus subsp. abscessus]|nr:Uncharacterised protein [Mycobacteroides abscessus subsp. abscessus]
MVPSLYVTFRLEPTVVVAICAGFASVGAAIGVKVAASLRSLDEQA